MGVGEGRDTRYNFTGSMFRRFLKYWAIFKTQVIHSLAYPADLIARAFTAVLFAWVFFHLWQAAYRSTGQGTLSGLTLKETLWYLVVAEAIVLSRPRMATGIAESVKNGEIAYLLSRPYNFLLYQASVGIGDSILRILLNAVAGGAVVWSVAGPRPDPRGWPMVFVAVVFGWAIDFCITAMIGLAAFVTEEVSSFEWIYRKFVLLLGGVLIPLDLFPAWLRDISLALPFASAVYGPARLFVSPGLARFAHLALTQVAWLGALGLVLGLLYRRSVAWLTVNGG